MLYVIFPHAALEPAHNNGFGPHDPPAVSPCRTTVVNNEQSLLHDGKSVI